MPNAIELELARMNMRKTMAETAEKQAAKRAANRRDPDHPDYEPEFLVAETAP